jgi:hypothetical protein
LSADFTLAQANDLAKYFLGKDWFGVQLSGQVILTNKTGAVYVGRSWREVFRAAGVQLPLRSQYVAQGVRVMMADRAICTAVSNTLAKRIAAALNNHIPDRRGI